MIREIKWETSKGNKAIVEIKFITEETIDADGDKITVPCCEMYMTTHLDGKILGYGEPRPLANVPGHTGVICWKLAVPMDKMEEINAAIFEVESTPEWQEKIARAEKAELESIEYEKHRAKMKRVMGY